MFLIMGKKVDIQNILLSPYISALKRKHKCSEYERELRSLQKYNFKDYYQG